MESPLRDLPICKKCSGSGWVPTKQAGLVRFRYCDCVTASKNRIRLTSIGIPPVYQDCTLANFQGSKETIKKVRQYIKDFDGSQGLIIFGKDDIQQMQLAIAVLKEINSKSWWYTCRFVSWPELVMSLRASYTGAEGSEAEILKPLTVPVLLFLSGIGYEYKKSDWSQSILYYLVNSRFEQKRGLILTLAPGSTVEKLGSRIEQRINEMCRRVSL